MRILMVGAPWFLDDVEDERRQDFGWMIKRAGGNTGNLFIGEAARFHVKRHFPDAEVVKITNWQIKNAKKITPEWADENFDMIVMGAANMLNERVNLPILANFVELTKLPFIIFGAGAQAEDTTKTIKLNKGTLRLVQIASERSASLGARGPYSVKVLNDNGIKNAEVSGCPSMYFKVGQDHTIQNPKKDDIKRVAMFAKWDNLRYQIHDQLRAFQNAQMKYGMDHNYGYVVQADFMEAQIAFTGTYDKTILARRSKNLNLPPESGDRLGEYFKTHGKSFA